MAASAKKSQRHQQSALEKCPTGIPGLDQVTNGGLPLGRTTLVCGGSGSGKTLFGMEFLVKGVRDYGEPGVFISFEENAEELAKNVTSLGFDVQHLIDKNKLVIDHVRIERSEIEESGEYDLEGLFIRLGFAIDSVGAKRVVLDTIEALFAALKNDGILRAELRRLFRWLKEKGVTAIITGERGDGTLTRHGLEEYVSDCVIVLDNRVTEQISTRRLRIVKYRGSAHGTNEYPFLLDEQGFTVVPLTAIGLQYTVSRDFVSTGIAKLDAMLGGQGYYRGGTLLVSGTAGSGKSSLAAHFLDAACRRGERSLLFAYEESPDQVIRNMRSIGINLKPWLDKDLLQIHASRPATFGLETHLSTIHRTIEAFQPKVVVFDPISSFESAGSLQDASAMLMRLVDFLKGQQITSLFTSLTFAGSPSEQSEVGISSLIDTWLLLRNLEQSGERTRVLFVLKARGMAHSNQVREFVLTDHGADLLDVYLGPNGILTGSAKAEQTLLDENAALSRSRDAERARLVLEQKRKAMTARIAELEAAFELECKEMEEAISNAEANAKNRSEGLIEAGRQREGVAISADKPVKEGRK
jgi:circadian clock protein KaiC